jgi:hypothetical protein
MRKHNIALSICAFLNISHRIFSLASAQNHQGPLFGKNVERFQADLVYKRSDKIGVVCEIKYSVNKISTTVIPEVQRKCDLLKVPQGLSAGYRSLV